MGAEAFDAATFAAAKSNLKKGAAPAAKKAAEPSKEQIDAIAKLYTKHKGDLKAVATECHCALATMQKNPPKDANDFAKKMLSGAYSLE
ncbi:unnamed protein product [Amoebophrya sp. A25]|nr:unnamed protein product [Amoebophrya sp. A25]|eukprot:GSA25T00009298001.1